MKFYVPTLGDKIYLLEPWTFTLYPEYRNSKLSLKLGLTKYETIINSYQGIRRCVNTKKPLLGTEGTSIPIAIPKDYVAKKNEYCWIDPASEVEIATSPHIFTVTEEHTVLKNHDKDFTITLPAKTVLTIDRIYIKKNSPEYDSITFFVDESPLEIISPKINKKGKRSGRQRFWVKLADANKIVCQLSPIWDLQAPASIDRFEGIMEDDS